MVRPAVFERLSGAPLRAIARLSGSELVERLGLRSTTERAIYEGLKAGTKAVKMANEAFAGPPKRLGASKGSGLYDPRPSEEQELVRDSMRRFGEEVLRSAARASD